MRNFFYLRLAWTGIRKNRQLYVPYLLTSVLMVTIFYIIQYLSHSPMMDTMRGGSTMQVVLYLGTYVMSLFSLIFLFYTNSFLIRRRNKEFGLYNILGMNKWNISRIIICEAVLTAGISLITGLFFGVMFSKASELMLLNLLKQEINYQFSVTLSGMAFTAGLFGVIFLLILFVSLFRVRLSNPLSLLKSENHGEKPPRANWLLAIVGLVVLIAAYIMSATIESPLTAITRFFVAVLMVIVATYLLFIAGSVVLCRILQKNKGYYYKPNHFISVSSMVYRMKRNGAGLASICILCTMVLVMLSSTFCLYIGGEDGIRKQYAYDFSWNFTASTMEGCFDADYPTVRAALEETAGDAIRDETEYDLMQTDGLMMDNGYFELDSDLTEELHYSYGDLREIYILPLSDYNKIMGTELTLHAGEVLLYSDSKPYPYDTIQLSEYTPVLRVKTVKDAPKVSLPFISVDSLYLFVDDFKDYVMALMQVKTASGRSLGYPYHVLNMNINLSLEEQIELEDRMLDALREVFRDSHQDEVNDTYIMSYGLNAYASSRDDFFVLNGSLFFLGILLSVVFLVAAVLMIYYKQVSEGFEDAPRFEIMKKVGMTGQEIRNSINSQVLTVFFAPLLMAGLHLAFAFPLIYRAIQVFGVNDLKLLIWVNIGCFLFFGIFYGVVYKVTSDVYYGIVNAIKEF